MKRILHSGLWLFSALLLVLVLLLALLVYSPKVNQWLLLQLTEKVAGLSVTDVDGLLLSEIHLYGLKYHMEQADISIESLSYRLDLSGLFAKQLEFDYLHLSGVNAVLLDSTQPVEQEPQAMTFVMPVILKVQDLAVNDVQIHQQNTDYIIKALKLNLHYQGQQIQLSQVFLDSDMFRLQGDAGLQLASGFPFIVDLTVIKPHPELGDIKAGIHLQGDSQKIYLQTDIQQPSAVHAQGWVDLSHASPQFDLACRWSLLQWPMQGIKQYASENAQLTLQGTVDDYLINLDTDVFAQDLISGALHLVGQGNAEQLTLNNLTLKALTGEVEAKGLLSWTDKIPSQIQLLAKNIQLDSFLAGYTGHFNLDTQLSGRLFDQPDIWLELNKLDGEILDKPLKAKAKIHYSAKQLLIEQLQANVGDNALTIQGIIGGHNALDFTLDAANLHELSSDLQGTAVAQGKLQGAMDKLVAQFELQSEGLKFQRQQLGRLNAVGRLSTEGEGKLDLDINARRLVLNGMKVDSFKFISSGQFAQHHFNASVASDQGNLELAMQGAWIAPANVWQGQIQQLKIKHSSAGKWQLIQSAPLEMKRTKQDSIQLQTDLCLTQRGSTGLVCLLAKNDLHKGQVFEGKISLLPLSIFSDYLPEAVQIDSHLQAKFFLQQTDLQGEITLSLTPGLIRMKHEQTGVQNVSFQSAQFDSQLQEGHLQSDVSVIFNEDNHIKGQVKVTGLEHTDTANIDGLLNIQLEDIGFMDAFIDSVSDMAGEVKAQLVLQGLFSAPQLDGSKIQLSDGKLFVPEMGLQVNNINIALSHAEQQQLVLQGKAQVVDEQILIDGQVEQYTSDQLKFQLAIKAKDLQIMQTPEIQLWVSPDLRLQGGKSGARLEGEVAIPKAIVIIESLPAGAVKLSDDEVIGAVKKSVPKEPAYALDADIKIRLGENVSLEGFGLKTLLQGQLQAVQKNNKLKLFNALSSVKGTYQAYGQDLEIEKGRLLFNGDMENPGVNILASRRASDWEDKTIAYLRMTGTLKNPVTTVYTEPALSESEALAYLLTGGSLGESDSSNAALLAAAAMGLGRDYIDALMGVIGIDEFDMKSTSVGQNSMVIGKRISSDLYARYIMDVLTSEMQFAVIYKLTKNISIETRAGYTHSSDIRYNIEFD